MKTKRTILLAAAAAIVVVVITALAVMPSVEPSTHFAVSQADLASQDSTAQAQAALEQFFNAIGSHDPARVRSRVTTDAAVVNWDVQRIVVESITPVSADSPYGSEAATGVKPPLQRTFRAPVRMWPSDGSYKPGELLDWSWSLERGADGQWRVASWGAG